MKPKRLLLLMQPVVDSFTYLFIFASIEDTLYHGTKDETLLAYLTTLLQSLH
jgi:hypothetical protein